MSTKQIEVNKMLNGEGCLGKAHSDEPIFVLRAQDLHAPYIVRKWADAAAVVLGDMHPKIIEARQLAAEMERWPVRKLPD